MEPEGIRGFDALNSPHVSDTESRMATSQKSIAIVGFPGAGKTTLVQSLQHVAATGVYQFLDMPGIHMLGRSTEAEQLVYDELLGRTERGAKSYPDGIIVVTEATNLDQQLYLAGQLIDLRLPVLLHVTRIEQARKEGLRVNVASLSAHLGIEVMSDTGEVGELLEKIDGWYLEGASPVKKKPVHWRPSIGLANAYNHLDKQWIFPHLTLHTGARLVEGLRLITVPKASEEYQDHPAYEALVRAIGAAREQLENRKENWTMVEVLQRHAAVRQIVEAAVKKEEPETNGGWLRSIFGKN